MLRYPIWFIFTFVSCSILVAAGYNAYVMSPRAGQQVHIAEGELPQKPLLEFLPFQTASCSDHDKERNRVYELELKTFPPIFREARQRGGGDVSYSCLQQSALGFKSDFEAPASRCGIHTGEGDPNCQKFEALRVTYNSILDISDCLDVSQREILPLLASESSFLPDLLPPMDEENRNQLKSWPQDRQHLAESEKASCRRLAQVLPADLKLGESCPSLRESVFHHLKTSRKFARVSQEIQDHWDASMLDSSLTEMDARLEDRMILRYWVHLLSYFTGSTKALSLAREFVTERLAQNSKIHPGELSWQGFLVPNNRQPASSFDSSWSQFLKKRLDTEAMAKLNRVANWLAWVKAHSLALECSTDLWTI